MCGLGGDGQDDQGTHGIPLVAGSADSQTCTCYSDKYLTTQVPSYTVEGGWKVKGWLQAVGV